MITISKTQKWGNSLAVRIPKETAKKLSLTDGSKVHVKEERGAIRITPIKKKRETIEERIARITPDNLNIDREWVNATPVGKEVW